MIISINQPAYLPWLGYFNRIVRSDLHIVLDHVQFEKNSFTNRNKILLNGQPIWLTVPVLTKGNFKNININSLKIDSQVNWEKKHWSSIQQAYSKSLHWSEFKDPLSNLYSSSSDLLNEVLDKSLQFFIKCFGIITPIEFSSNYDFKEKKSDLVLEICKKFKATKYLSGPFGRSYLEECNFNKMGIEIVYDDYIHPVYSQRSESFIPYLSALDLLANCGDKSLGILKND